MINSPFFSEGAIPHLLPLRYYPTDIISFPEIARAAQTTVDRCVRDAKKPPQQCAGYTLVGGRESIGVFVWGTSSTINSEVGRSVNEVGVSGLNVTVELGVNSTANSELSLMELGGIETMVD